MNAFIWLFYNEGYVVLDFLNLTIVYSLRYLKIAEPLGI